VLDCNACRSRELWSPVCTSIPALTPTDRSTSSSAPSQASSEEDRLCRIDEISSGVEYSGDEHSPIRSAVQLFHDKFFAAMLILTSGIGGVRLTPESVKCLRLGVGQLPNEERADDQPVNVFP
jgi:hypothetical protein